MTYAFWNSETSIDAQEDEHHHDEEFLHFSNDLIKTHGIEIREATPGQLKQRVRAPAMVIIAADQIAHILPKVNGIVVKAYKNLGQTVTKNEVLATIESKEMAEAKAAYLTAIKKQQLADSNFTRESSLYEKKLSSAEDFHNAENNKGAASIDLELTRQKLHALGLSYENIKTLPQESSNSMKTYELVSPIAGQVIARHITIGEMVSSDSEVYVVADLSVVWAEINVFANDRKYVNVGQPVTIIDNHGQTADTTVMFLSPIVDQDSRTSLAIVAINNASGKWLPGTFAQAEFVTDTVDASLSVPKTAIQNIDGNDVIFVSQDDGFAVRPVTIGQSDQDHCEILSGLKPGENYASKNTFLLKADLKKDEAEHMD